jgi:hypothetical protein
MRTIRAGEIGAYLFCRRAWWYALQGVESQNQAELAAGTKLHQRHSRQVLVASFLRALATLAFLAGLALLAYYLTTLLLA